VSLTVTALHRVAPTLSDLGRSIPPDNVLPVEPGELGRALRALADVLGVDRVGVAVDHPQGGRQVFVDGSRPLGDLVGLLDGPVGVATVPAVVVDPALEQLVVAGALAAVDRSQCGPDLWRDLRTSLRWCARANRPVAVIAADADPVTVAAMCRSSANAGPGVGLRCGEVLVEVGPGRFVWVLVGVGSGEAPAALHRLEADAALGALTFGVAQFPIDGEDAERLVMLAIERLTEATDLAG
jgi:hypothetical protein